MKNIQRKILPVLIVLFLSVNATASGQTQKSSVTDSNVKKNKRKKKHKKFKLPDIDLSHWKVTTPAGEGKKPIEVASPEILNYATDERLIPFMYNDSSKGALVFYAFPSKATTSNTKYSRSELREQMTPGSNANNWTFKEGGIMKGKLAIDEISRDSDGKYHKTIIMQIHGRLTNEQRDLIGAKDNNAPPILKIYWQNGKIRVKTKVLKNLDLTTTEMLHEEAWGDDKGYTFKEEVGFKKFNIEVKISQGKMVVVLNKNEYKVYENIHMEKWGVFENYFKAGNYFQSRDEGAFAKVRYYQLEVSH